MLCLFKHIDSKKVGQVKAFFFLTNPNFSRFLVVLLSGFCLSVVYLNLHFQRFHTQDYPSLSAETEKKIRCQIFLGIP